MIFWGPPGVGKTTLARIIANKTKAFFVSQSAVNTTLEDVRKIVSAAKERKELYGQKTIFFLDEIHRFNKAQQDAFLPQVENGTIVLIGATTENPSFEVIGPLLSRCRVFVLQRLTNEELGKILKNALRILKKSLSSQTEKFLIQAANGDSRNLLNILEIAANLSGKRKEITFANLKTALLNKTLLYDRLGEEHYNTISAYIKSLRAGDVDAAIYYLARMVEAGEDPLFIARRMVIFASEDIGIAQPTALVVANEVFKACEEIGYPECKINLAHGTVYLALAKKSRSAYNALMEASKDVETFGNLPIPLEIRNAPTSLMKALKYGEGYEPYPKNKSFLPDKLKKKKYFRF
jgi:putative ATPase